jgi:hypothetical protein
VAAGKARRPKSKSWGGGHGFWPSIFLPKERGTATAGRRKARLFLGFFCGLGFSFDVSKLTLVNFLPLFLCVLQPLFLSKVAWSPKHIGPSTSLFFVNFNFFLFFCIFENEQYQCQLNKKNQ